MEARDRRALSAAAQAPKRQRAVETCFNLDRLDGKALFRGHALGPMPFIGVAVVQTR